MAKIIGIDRVGDVVDNRYQKVIIHYDAPSEKSEESLQCVDQILVYELCIKANKGEQITSAEILELVEKVRHETEREFWDDEAGESI